MELKRKGAGSYLSNKRKPRPSARETRTIRVDVIKDNKSSLSEWRSVIATVVSLIGALVIINL